MSRNTIGSLRKLSSRPQINWLVAHYEVGEYFINAGETLGHEDHGVFLQRLHSSGSGDVAKLVALGAPRNSAFQLIVHGEKLINTDAPFFTGVVALVTTFTFVERRSVLFRI